MYSNHREETLIRINYSNDVKGLNLKSECVSMAFRQDRQKSIPHDAMMSHVRAFRQNRGKIGQPADSHTSTVIGAYMVIFHTKRNTDIVTTEKRH